jgi:hypothetical protein
MLLARKGLGYSMLQSAVLNLPDKAFTSFTNNVPQSHKPLDLMLHFTFEVSVDLHIFAFEQLIYPICLLHYKCMTVLDPLQF